MNGIIPRLPSETPAFAQDPYRYLAEARKEHPWLARFAEGYVVHGYQQSVDLLTDEENLRIGYGMIIDFYGVRSSMWARFMEEMMLSVSGESHRQLRDSVAHAFTPRRANRERETMRRVINGLLGSRLIHSQKAMAAASATAER